MADEAPIAYVGPGFEDLVDENGPQGIWLDLRNAIEARVKKDGVRKDAILPGSNEDYFIQDAVEQIYYDVAEFYYWYFDPEDDRNITMANQKKVEPSPALADAVEPVVLSNLASMRDVDEIPTGLDSPALTEVITKNLVQYIQDWQDWYYDFKEQDAIENYYEIKGFNDAIYYDSDYGDYTNIDSNVWDGLDVPYIGEEE